LDWTELVRIPALIEVQFFALSNNLLQRVAMIWPLQFGPVRSLYLRYAGNLSDGTNSHAVSAGFTIIW